MSSLVDQELVFSSLTLLPTTRSAVFRVFRVNPQGRIVAQLVFKERLISNVDDGMMALRAFVDSRGAKGGTMTVLRGVELGEWISFRPNFWKKGYSTTTDLRDGSPRYIVILQNEETTEHERKTLLVNQHKVETAQLAVFEAWKSSRIQYPAEVNECLRVAHEACKRLEACHLKYIQSL